MGDLTELWSCSAGFTGTIAQSLEYEALGSSLSIRLFYKYRASMKEISEFTSVYVKST